MRSMLVFGYFGSAVVLTLWLLIIIVPAPVIEVAKVDPVAEKAVPKVEVKEPEKVVAVEEVVEKVVAPPPAPVVVEAKGEQQCRSFILHAQYYSISLICAHLLSRFSVSSQACSQT